LFWGVKRQSAVVSKAILRAVRRFSSDFWAFLVVFPRFSLVISDAAVQGHWSGVTGGGSPPPKCWKHVAGMLIGYPNYFEFCKKQNDKCCFATMFIQQLQYMLYDNIFVVPRLEPRGVTRPGVAESERPDPEAGVPGRASGARAGGRWASLGRWKDFDDGPTRDTWRASQWTHTVRRDTKFTPLHMTFDDTR
jgi:hypothetical protein